MNLDEVRLLCSPKVDGLASPMVGHDPLSTRVGNALSSVVGPQLTAKFHHEAGGATLPGDIVLVDGLPTLQSNGVFFLNLVPWDNNQQGTAVQVKCFSVFFILS